MKLGRTYLGGIYGGSHPVWGAWIEMLNGGNGVLMTVESHPVWGAWIEIVIMCPPLTKLVVAPRVGCVD